MLLGPFYIYDGVERLPLMQSIMVPYIMTGTFDLNVTIGYFLLGLADIEFDRTLI